MAQDIVQYAFIVDATDGGHELRELRAQDVLGPVDFGLRMQKERRSVCIGSGVLAGSVIPGSNRLIFCGHSPVWDGFYVSTMGGASLIWDGTGISFLAIGGRASEPSAIVLWGEKGAHPKLRLVPLDVEAIWADDGFYGLQRHVFEQLWEGGGTPRVLAVGPAAARTDMGAIGSSKTRKGEITAADCWAGRGGFGSALFQRHYICAIVYGGDFDDDDLTDRAEADGYFQKRFSKKMKLVDLETTTKYRFDPRWGSGGTFGVNYASLCEQLFSFNYRSVNWGQDGRRRLWKRLVRDHYLAQFNAETIEPKQQSNCGEPCPAVCKKLHGEYKKDYEPYQTMGPLTGIFDQRAAERVNHRADALGFDAIQIGGQLAWIMECLHDGVVGAGQLGLPAEVPDKPVFDPEGFDAVADSATNAELALALLDLCVQPGHLLSRGMRAAAKALGPEAVKRAVYLCNGDRGWMVPNQYWVPGMFAPQSIMGKYYTYYKPDYHSPRELGRIAAERMLAELTTDNSGLCRFHRGWSEKLWPEIVCGHFGVEIDYPAHHVKAVKEIHAQARPVYWESERCEEIIHRYLESKREDVLEHDDLGSWLFRFDQDRPEAARAFWQEIKAGIDERMAGFGDDD
ncbi:MAG: aldehyde ferredoxin oxidoreductase [Deltaproteobacteria bacterium]|nr:aldehyde ferredoxin oxidoreductase [Deltaproteobacteria bacterium]